MAMDKMNFLPDSAVIPYNTVSKTMLYHFQNILTSTL